MCSCLLYLFCRPTDLAPRWDTACVLAHVHLCIEPALHSTHDKLPGRDHRMEPDVFHLERFCLSAVHCITPFCCEHYCCLAAVREGMAAVKPTGSSSTDMLRTTAQCRWHTFSREEKSLPFSAHSPFPTFLIKDMIFLHTSNSVSLCWHSDKTTVSITLWPFSLSFNSTTLMNNIVH